MGQQLGEKSKEGRLRPHERRIVHSRQHSLLLRLTNELCLVFFFFFFFQVLIAVASPLGLRDATKYTTSQHNVWEATRISCTWFRARIRTPRTHIYFGVYKVV